MPNTLAQKTFTIGTVCVMFNYMFTNCSSKIYVVNYCYVICSTLNIIDVYHVFYANCYSFQHISVVCIYRIQAVYIADITLLDCLFFVKIC